MKLHPQSTPIKGYRKKPIWIYLVAILFILTPMIHLSLTLKNAGEVNWWSPSAWWTWIQYLNPAPAIVSVLLFVSGISILLVKKWAWWVGMMALSSLSIYNIALISHSFSDDPVVKIIATLGSFGLLALLFFSDFKQPFFNKRLRWWESESRYKVSVPVKIVGTQLHALLVDLSKSGVYLESSDLHKPLSLPDNIEIEVNSELKMHCTFSRKTKSGAAYKFVNISKHQSSYLRRWLKLLSKDPTLRVR